MFTPPNGTRMKRKPDALLLLALFFGLGLVVSSLTHGEGNADPAGQAAVTAAAHGSVAQDRSSR
jgi:hypothetical protein